MNVLQGWEKRDPDKDVRLFVSCVHAQRCQRRVRGEGGGYGGGEEGEGEREGERGEGSQHTFTDRNGSTTLRTKRKIPVILPHNGSTNSTNDYLHYLSFALVDWLSWLGWSL